MDIFPSLIPLLFFIILFSFVATTQENGGLQTLSIPSPATGPESIAFDRFGGGPYTGVSDGRILKWQGGRDGGWTIFAIQAQRWEGCSSSSIHLESMCGRPLGLQFNKVTGELYIADAYFGLLAVGPEGGAVQQMAAEADGVPFCFTNGVDVDEETGLVYFTDSSIHFQRWEYQLLVASGDATGRFMKYDPANKKVTVLLDGVTFPNGVALSKDKSFVVVAGTTDCKVSRYWLKGPKAGEFELFADLPGYPDNIKRNEKGEFWVGINRERIRLGGPLAPAAAAPAAIKLSSDGRVLEVLAATVMSPLSEVLERNGTMWLGSVDLPYVGFGEWNK